jgi:colicin import membrane protein
MREASIRKAAAISALLHLAFFFISVIVVDSKKVAMPSPYTVTLVNPDKPGRPQANTKESATEAKTVESPAPEKQKVVKESKTEESKTVQKSRIDEQMVDDRISELISKKKVERIVKLRSVISVGSSNIKSSSKAVENKAGASGSQGSMFDSYYGKITDEIRQEWVYPDMGKKDLEATIAVLIRRDGTVSIQGVEKSSGDLLFDRSALKAITKASPVSPPPYEMEIGMRFYP